MGRLRAWCGLVFGWWLAACSGSSTPPSDGGGGSGTGGNSGPSSIEAGADGQSDAGGSPRATAGQGGQTDGGSGPVDMSSLSRVISYPNPLGQQLNCRGGECGEGERCFGITREFGMCAPQAIAEANSCPAAPVSEPNECGCDGMQCPAGQLCRTRAFTCSCGGGFVNGCVEPPCETDADCGDDICVPSRYIWGKRCIKADCRSDADCGEHPGMRCVVKLITPTQRGEVTFGGTQCVFNERPAISDTCANIQQWAEDAFTCY